MKGCISDEVDDYTEDCTSLIPPWLIVSLSLLKPLLELQQPKSTATLYLDIIKPYEI